MATHVYKVVPFEGSIKGSGSTAEVSNQLQALINSTAADGWELVTMADVGIAVSPGCLAGLMGQKTSYTRYDQLIFRRPA